MNRYVVNTHSLYSKETDRVIQIHADLVCIDYEGGVLDACSLALLAALINLRIPSLSLKEEELVLDYGMGFILSTPLLLAHEHRTLPSFGNP